MHLNKNTGVLKHLGDGPSEGAEGAKPRNRNLGATKKSAAPQDVMRGHAGYYQGHLRLVW